MANRDIVVIGGSAGSTAPLRALVQALPDDLKASLFVVTHVPTRGTRLLRDILQQATTLPVAYAEDGEPVAPGRIYLAPADRHLLVGVDGIVLGRGPRENMVRPAIDPLFRSAALAFGPRVIGVILSGMLDDGASGLSAVKAQGGLAVVQHPGEAHAPDMPSAAMAAVRPDHVVASEAIGPLLVELTGTPAPANGAEAAPDLQLEVEIAVGGRSTAEKLARIADPAPITCPNCQGVLSEVRGETPLRYRCQTGHAVTAAALDVEQHSHVEEALRVAMRVMEERTALVIRMGEDARVTGRTATAALYERRGREYGEQAEVLRKAVLALMEQAAEDDADNSSAT